MSFPIIPWELSNFPDQIQRELKRRSTSRGLSYVQSEKGSWNSETGDWTKYNGPMNPWVRFCSNGFGSILINKPGFVFYAGQDFYSGYGFSVNSEGIKETTLGFTPEGNPHILENNLKTTQGLIHVPPPQIENIRVIIQKELFRRATITWNCFSPQQLEYMTPYFLTAGISCILEWGWNHFEQSSLIDLTDISNLKELYKNPYPLYNVNILKSNGNYDVLFGIISGFQWRLEGNKIVCTTEITSKDRIYAGLSIEDVTLGGNQSENKDNIQPLGNLRTFLKTCTTQFKSIRDFSKYSEKSIDDPFSGIRDFINYLKVKKSNYEEYLYGVYYGRDIADKTAPPDVYRNKYDDWDGRSTGDNLWINLGMVMEIINYHSSDLKDAKGNPMFDIDIENVVISAHPNLISTNGSVLLIPNKESPKYFLGNYGDRYKYSNPDSDVYPLENSTWKTESLKKKEKNSPDFHLRRVCYQPGGFSFRDNHDIIINGFRYNKKVPSFPCEFPFKNDYENKESSGSKPYPARYSGFLKNLYVHVEFLQKMANSETTMTGFVEKVLEGISAAAGNFWDLRLINGTSTPSEYKKSATMKIVDFNFVSTSNTGEVFSFDYLNSDSLLLSGDFNPTLSDAVAIRTMFDQSNVSGTNEPFTNNTELLHGNFKDRLLIDNNGKSSIEKRKSSTSWIQTMKSFQKVVPPQNAFQVTSKDSGQVVVKRLVLPDPDGSILRMLLDDRDLDYNPKYTGIMPGIQSQFTIVGIGGLRTFMVFLVRNLPHPYSEKNIIFRIVDLQEELNSDGKWITKITAGIIPLRKHIKERLGLK